MPARTDQPLGAGQRYRCDACGNVTRFDVTATTRTRRYLHFDLGGAMEVDEEDILEETVVSVSCRWCARSDAIRVETAPAAGSGGEDR